MWRDRDRYPEHNYVSDTFWLVVAALLFAACGLVWLIGQVDLVATGTLDPREVHQGLLVAAERCGLLEEEPRQTHRTLASGRQVGLAHPGRPRQPPSPERTHPSPIPPARAVGERTKEGRRRPWLAPATKPAEGVQGVGACRRQAEPAPTPTTRRKEPAWAATPP